MSSNVSPDKFLELADMPQPSSSKKAGPKAVPEAQEAITASADAAASNNPQEAFDELKKKFEDEYGSLLTTQVTGRPFVTCQASRTQSTKGSTLSLLDSLKELPCRQPSWYNPTQLFMKSSLIEAKKDCVDKFNVEIDKLKALLEEEKITPDDAKEAAKDALLRLQEHVQNAREASDNTTTKREARNIVPSQRQGVTHYECQVCEVTRRHPPGNLDKAISEMLQEKFHITTILPKDGEIMNEKVVDGLHIQTNNPEVWGLE